MPPIAPLFLPRPNLVVNGDTVLQKLKDRPDGMFLDRCASALAASFAPSPPSRLEHHLHPRRVFPASAESLDGCSGTAANDPDALSSVVNNWSRPQQLSSKAMLFGTGSGSRTLRQVCCLSLLPPVSRACCR